MRDTHLGIVAKVTRSVVFLGMGNWGGPPGAKADCLQGVIQAMHTQLWPCGSNNAQPGLSACHAHNLTAQTAS